MRKLILSPLAFCLLITQQATSQALRQPISAPYLGLSAYSKEHTDVFSFVNNQAALAQTKYAAAGIYAERRYQLAATSVYSAAIAVPSAMGNFGISVKYAGYKNFNESQFGLAYARSLGSKVDLGVQFNYYGYRVPTYNSAGTVNFEVGAIIHLTNELNIGMHVYNPVGGGLSKMDEKLTAACKVGLGYDASESFFLSAEVVKEEAYPVNMIAGIQYRFAKQFYARVGLSSANAASYAGVGIAWGNLRLDLTGSYHPQLGLSPGLLLIMNFDGKASSNSPASTDVAN